MNRGYKIYFMEALKKATHSLMKEKNYVKYYAHYLISLLGLLFIIPSPIIYLSKVRMSKMIRNQEKMNISESFASSNNPKTFWTMLLCEVIHFFMFISGLLLIALFIFVCETIGVAIYYFIHVEGFLDLIMALFAIPGAILLIFYVIYFLMAISPTSYIVDSIEDVKATIAIRKSFEAIRNGGKRTLFLNTLLMVLIKGIYLGLSTTLIAYMYSHPSDLVKGFGCLVFVILLGIYLVGAPIVTLTFRIINLSLHEDIVLDRYNSNKQLKGIYVKNQKTKKVEVENYKDNLIHLFDETDDEIVPKELEKLSEFVSEPTNSEEVEVKEEIKIDIPKEETPVPTPTPKVEEKVNEEVTFENIEEKKDVTVEVEKEKESHKEEIKEEKRLKKTESLKLEEVIPNKEEKIIEENIPEKKAEEANPESKIDLNSVKKEKIFLTKEDQPKEKKEEKKIELKENDEKVEEKPEKKEEKIDFFHYKKSSPIEEDDEEEEEPFVSLTLDRDDEDEELPLPRKEEK